MLLNKRIRNLIIEGDQTWDVDALAYPHVTFSNNLAQKRAVLKCEIDSLDLTEFRKRCKSAQVETGCCCCIKGSKAIDELIDKELAEDEKSNKDGCKSRQTDKSVNSLIFKETKKKIKWMSQHNNSSLKNEIMF